MSTVAVNLKHFYQRWGLWFWYVILLVLVVGLTQERLRRADVGPGDFTGYLVLSLAAGIIAAELQRDVLTKPFAYCLPGHRFTMRKLLFWVGFVVNGIGALVFVAYPELQLGHKFIVVISAFFAGMICYWLAVWTVLSIMKTGPVLGFVPIIGLVLVWFNLHISLGYAIVNFPFYVSTAGLVLCIVVWRWLGEANLARDCCGRVVLGSADIFNIRFEKYWRTEAARKSAQKGMHAMVLVERFFLAQTNKYSYLSTGRYVWGALYSAGGLYLSLSSKVFLIFLSGMPLLLALFGYIQPALTIGYVILGWTAGLSCRLPFQSSMLVGGGRKERYYGTIAVAVAHAFYIMVIATVVFTASKLLAAVLPESITLRGETFTYHTVPEGLILAPLALVAISFTVRLFFRRMLILPMALGCGVFSGTVFALQDKLRTAKPMLLVIVALLILAWAVFLVALRYVCMRRCLVGQGRQ